MIDICLFNWKTELSNESRIKAFQEKAQYRNGILHKIDFPLREPPTGLMLLAAIVEDLGYSVDIIDATLLENPQQFIQEKISDYRMFGLTSLTNTFPEIQNIARYAKKINPNLFIVMGGPHVSFTSMEVLKQMPEIDVICMGEAEKTFPWVIENLLDKPAIDFLYDGDSQYLSNTFNRKNRVSETFLSLPKIPKGLAFRKSTLPNPDFVETGFPLPMDLAQLPLPARHLISRIYQVADIIVNRGCPNQCSFCSRTHLFPTMRLRPLDQVMEEVDYILSCGNYRFINFYDNINIKKSYFEQFLQELIARPSMLPWGAELRSDGITLDQAQTLVRSNCKVVATGVESASEEVLRTNFKFQNIEEVRKGIVNFKKAGISVQAYFVIGLPGDTPEEFNKTLEYLKSLPLKAGEDQVDFFVATPYPGSDLRLNPAKYGINILNHPYSQYNCHEILLETETLSQNQIQEMIEQAASLKIKLGI